MVPGLLVFARPATAAQDPTPVPALVVPEPPSLVEIARQEEARRRALKGGKSKVYSDKDLKKPSPGQAPAPGSGSTPASGSASGSGSAGTPGSAPPPTSTTPVPDASTPSAGAPKTAGENEEQWRNRMKQARENLRQNEVFAEALQTRINALTTDFVNRDDPAQRGKVGEDRQKAVAELDRVRNEIENSKKAIFDIEEDARKANVPPGWLR